MNFEEMELDEFFKIVKAEIKKILNILDSELRTIDNTSIFMAVIGGLCVDLCIRNINLLHEFGPCNHLLDSFVENIVGAVQEEVKTLKTKQSNMH